MKAKKRRRMSKSAGSDVEVISLRDAQALLAANDRMNEVYGDGYVACLDTRRGMKLYRRIVAHGQDPLAVNQAIDLLMPTERRKVVLHYAMKPRDYIEIPPGRM